MTTITRMRFLRNKYNIPMRELAQAAGVSQQYMSDLELGKYQDRYDYRKGGGPLVQRAFEGVAETRLEQARRLSGDIEGSRGRLLDYMEDGYEL